MCEAPGRLGRVTLVAMMLALAGCEHTVDLSGRVVVPVPVQQMFSAAHPGLLMMKAELHRGRPLRFYSVVLCAPTDGELVLEVHSIRFGCATPGAAEISASVVFDTHELLSCEGPAPISFGPDPAPGTVVASGEAQAPMAIAWGWMGCKSGSGSFALHLAPRSAR
jgi:hypothetical protein